MTRLSSRRSPRVRPLATAAAVAVGTALALPSAAGAATFCVGMTSAECPNGTVLSLQGSLSVSQASPSPDTIRIKAGDPYVGPFRYRTTNNSNRVTLVGVGDTKPLITSRTGDAGVLDMQLASLENLRISVPKLNGARGAILDNARMDKVDVTGGGAAENVGAALFESVMVNSTSDVPGGVGAVVGGGGNFISGSTVSGDRAVNTFGADLTVLRSRLRGADRALDARFSPGAQFAQVSVIASLLTTTVPAGQGVVVRNTPPVQLVRTTVASLAPVPAVDSRAVTVSADASSFPVTLDSTVLAGYRAGIVRTAQPGFTAPLSASHSEWDASHDSLGGAGVGTVSATDNVDGVPRMVDRVGGDLRLRGGDPAIDRDPSTNATHRFDIDFAASVDGDASGDARPDAGAFEYRRQAPALDVNAPSAGAPGTPLSFAATATDADGDDVEVSWAFGDGSTAAASTAAHVYTSPGTYQGTAVARDEAGVTTTRPFTVTIAAGPGGPDTADRIAPAFATLALTPRKLRASASRKLRLRLQLSEAATVRITVKKRVKSRSVRLRRAIVLRLPAGASSKRVGGALRKSRALRPGRYTLSVTATDRAGNRSKAKRLRLTVLPRR